MFARIENEKVVEILDVEVLPEFHPDLVWVACDESVKEGFEYDGETFSDPVTVESIRDTRLSALKSFYRQKIEGGFTYDGKLFHLDSVARANMGMMKLAISAGDVSPHGGYWIGKTGKHIMSDQDVIALANTALSAYQSLLFKHQEHAEALYALNDKQDILDYDITADWPAV